MSTHKITVELDLDPDLFRQQRHALIQLLDEAAGDVKENVEGLVNLTDYIADVAADQYGLKSCLLTADTEGK